MESMDVFESVVDFGREQETVLGYYFEADTVQKPGIWMTVSAWAVLQKGHRMQQLFGSELQAETEFQDELGTGAGSGIGAELKAEQSVAGLLEGSSLMTEMMAEFWLVVPVSGVIIYSVHLYLLLKWKQ